MIRARLEKGLQVKEIEDLFGVSDSSVKLWVREFKQSGKTKAAKGNRGAKAQIRGENEVLFRALLEEFPDATLVELSNLLWERAGIEIGESGLSRTCKRLGITRKKNASRK